MNAIDHLAGEAFAAKAVVDPRVDHDHLARARCRSEIFASAQPYLDLLRSELDGAVRKLDDDLLVFFHLGVEGRTVRLGEGLLAGRDLLAKLRSQHAEVRNQLELDVLAWLLCKPELTHVELLSDRTRETVDGLPLGIIRHDDNRFRERLPHLELVFVSNALPQGHHVSNPLHGPPELFVDACFILLRKRRQVHRFRCGVVVLANQVLEQCLGQEGDERRRKLGQVDQHVVERAERRAFVGRIIRRPEARPTPADIPIRQPIHEAEEVSHRHVTLVVIELFSNRAHRRIELGKHPTIHVGPLLERRTVDSCGPPVDIRVGHEEAIDVPDLQEEFAHSVGRRVIEEPRILPGHRARIERPADRIRAHAIHEHQRIGVVLVALAELLALLVGHQTEDDAVFERMGQGALRKHERADRHQRVEPAAGLIDRFGDEIGREAALEAFPVLVRKTPLRERHTARIEPAVDDLRHAPVHARLTVAGPGHLVDPRLVNHQVVLQRGIHGLCFFEVRKRVGVSFENLGCRTDRLYRTGLIVLPNRKWRSPEALT